MFGTALSYVTLRLLGVSPDDAQMEAARAWVRGALSMLCMRPLGSTHAAAGSGLCGDSSRQLVWWLSACISPRMAAVPSHATISLLPSLHARSTSAVVHTTSRPGVSEGSFLKAVCRSSCDKPERRWRLCCACGCLAPAGLVRASKGCGEAFSG